MSRIIPRILPLFLLILSACGNSPPAAAPTPTWTPEPCASTNLNTSIKPINDLQREFDDASGLASNLPVDQLDEAILNMQRIRRDAEDITPPPCLVALQSYQIAHMNAVIDTMIAFVGGADTNTLGKGLELARRQHDLYTVEMARVLGVTLVPATPAAP